MIAKIIPGLLIIITVLALWVWDLRSDNADLNKELLKRDIASEQAKTRYLRDSAAFDYALKEVVKFYDGTIADIKSFKKGSNETDCDAANRLLNRFGS